MKHFPEAPELQRIMDRFEKEKEAREKRKNEELERKEEAKIIKLPMWSDHKRAVPNAALRGSLFAAIHPNQRKAFQGALIVNEENLQIRFTGWQLDQSDRDVWEMALHIARTMNLGYKIEFSIYSFLKALGRRTGNKDHEWLKGSFRRLMGCGVEITHQNMTYGGSLMEFWRDETSGRYKLKINPKLARLYSAGFTSFDREDRRKIGAKKPLALWLHGYVSGHAKMYPTKIETFHRLSGSSNACMRDFKRRLIEALTILEEKELIRGFGIKDDLVLILNIPSKAQETYLRATLS